MAKNKPAAGAAGVVRSFDPGEGWGVIDAPEAPGGCFVHFSNIEMEGYRALAVGQRVRFAYEQARFPAGRLPVPRAPRLA